MVAAWLELIPYMEPDDLRMLLDERGAFRWAELLQAAGIPLAGAERDPRALELAAAVLAEMRGHPNDVLEGEPMS
jgi:hypothetical protein